MTDIEIRKLGALEIGAAIKEGKITSVEATRAFLDAIDAKDGEYKSYITVIRDEALAKAQKAFNKNKYDNLIELSLMNDDELLSPWAVGMGQIVNVISDGVSYGSILTGREMKDNVTTLIFGTIRQELTKYLKGRAN